MVLLISVEGNIPRLRAINLTMAAWVRGRQLMSSALKWEASGVGVEYV